MAYMDEDPNGWPMITLDVPVFGKRWRRIWDDKEPDRKLLSSQATALMKELDEVVTRHGEANGWFTQIPGSETKFWKWSP